MGTPKILTPAQERQKTFREFMSDPKRTKAIEKVAPAHLSPERLVNLATNAVMRTPALLECDVMTVYAAIIQAAELGLEPNTALGLAYLVPFYNSKAGRKECVLIIGYRGLVGLAFRSGLIAAADAQGVFKGDDFSVQRGTARRIHHVPTFETEETLDNLTHAYAVFETTAGGTIFEAKGKSQILAHRDKFSAQKSSGPWRDHPVAMCKKTVVRLAINLVPMTAEMSKAISLDNAHDSGDYSGLEFTLPEANPDQASEANEPKGAVAKLAEKVGGDEGGTLLDPNEIPEVVEGGSERGR